MRPDPKPVGSALRVDRSELPERRGVDERLLDAARAVSPAAVERALAQGADPNARGDNGATALWWAASVLKFDKNRLTRDQDAALCAKLLLAAGAAVDEGGPDGEPPLLGAIARGRFAAQALLEAGADVDAKDAMGLTALMQAAMHGRTRLVAELCARGAEIDAATSVGSTALIVAASEGRLECVEELAARGADVWAQRTDGLRAQDMAAKGGHVEVARRLGALMAEREAAMVEQAAGAASALSKAASRI